MEIIRIDADEYGCIGLARNKQAAIDLLIEDGWVGVEEKFYVPCENKWLTMVELFGEDWENELKSWDLEKLKDFFDGYLYFGEIKVYEGRAL